MGVKKIGFLQALGVVAYCFLVGVVFSQGPRISPKVNSYFGPVVLLLLFSVSALICGLIVFYKPYKLFSSDKKKAAVDVVVFTALWLLVFFFLLFPLMLVIK